MAWRSVCGGVDFDWRVDYEYDVNGKRYTGVVEIDPHDKKKVFELREEITKYTVGFHVKIAVSAAGGI